MIKISQENKSGVVNLHNIIYNLEAIKESADKFKEFFSSAIEEKPNYHVINFAFNQVLSEAEYKKICLEFCNYVFVLMKNKSLI